MDLEDSFRSLFEARKPAFCGRNIDVSDYRSKLVYEEGVVVESIELKHDLKQIGIGSGRVIFKTGNGNVYKVARFGGYPPDDGRYQNKVEVMLNETIESSLFLPVTDYGERYIWIKMPRVVPLTDCKKYSEEERKEIVSDIHNRLKDEINTLDIRAENIGIFNDNPVLLDYGTAVPFI